jgi:cellulose synthase (UDP-forming)
MRDTMITCIELLIALFLLKSAVAEDSRWARSLVAALAVGLGVRYIIWRWSDTLFVPAMTVQFVWPLVFVFFETTRFFNEAFTIWVLTRTKDRRSEADAGEARLRLLGPDVPAVDVFIPTYDENPEILRRTILGAKALDWPNFRIFVMDDTARDWLRELCLLEGVNYIARKNGAHAKAGNFNNALERTRDGGAPFILCLDADFVPFRNFLWRTVGFFQDPTIAIVQTPQYFFNPDPTQVNLKSARNWVDEQRFFFDVYQESKDAVDASFCCGTSCVWRREAIDAIGGVPTDSVVEDIHLSFKLMARGWTTRYLNEILSNGLAAESIGEFVAQRVRWGIGCVQALHAPYGPFQRNALTLTQRLHYLSTIVYWLNLAFMPVAILAPAIYYLGDVWTLHSSLEDLALHFLPYAVVQLFYMAWTARGRIVPLLSEVTLLVFAMDVTRAVWPLLVFKKSRAFHVTKKGLSVARRTVNWRLVGRLSPLLLLNLAGLVVSQWPEIRRTTDIGGDQINLVWAVVSVLMTGLAMLMCIEVPRLRKSDRFEVGEVVDLVDTDGGEVPAGMRRAILEDVSMVGARCSLSDAPGKIRFEWRGIDLHATRVWTGRRAAAYAFDHDAATERALTVALYTGGLHSTAHKARVGRFIGNLSARLFMN